MGGDTGGDKLFQRVQSLGWRTRAGFEQAGQARIEAGDGDADSGQSMPRQFGQQIEIVDDARTSW